jgi:hypothetical protein
MEESGDVFQDFLSNSFSIKSYVEIPKSYSKHRRPH